jgi:hypothetical protein
VAGFGTRGKDEGVIESEAQPSTADTAAKRLTAAEGLQGMALAWGRRGNAGRGRIGGRVAAPAGQQDTADSEGDDDQRDDSQQPATARAESGQTCGGSQRHHLMVRRPG